MFTSCTQSRNSEQSKTNETNETDDFRTDGSGQNAAFDSWEEEAERNIRLRPKYGKVIKTKEQIEADEAFIRETLQQRQFAGDRTKASNQMVKTGFDYLYKGDLKTAMYRFNQAYLLDSLNSDIYWGFGGIYMTLQKYEEAKMQYLEGLSISPNNTHLLTDLGTYYSLQCQLLQPTDEIQALISLDSAIINLKKSYAIDSQDPNTTFKLSTCYLVRSDCDNAWRYYEECVALGGQPIPDGYAEYIKSKCGK
jgi:Tfp pilus assembly protein PilF